MSTQRTKLSPGRVVAIVIAVIVLVPILLLVIGFWPRSIHDLEAVANKFQPGEGWVLESERISPSMFICLQADCGEVYRVWHGSPGAFKRCDEFAALTHHMTGAFSVDDEAKLRNDNDSIIKSCNMQRLIDGKSIIISYQSYNDSEPSVITLGVSDR